MADEADSKSVVGNHVWVQVPLPALFYMNHKPDKWFVIFYFLLFNRRLFMTNYRFFKKECVNGYFTHSLTPSPI